MYNDTTIGCLEYWSNQGYTVRLERYGSISFYDPRVDYWYYLGIGPTI